MSKLGKLQRERLDLISEMDELRTQKRALEAAIRKKARKLKDVGNAIYDLKHEGDTPHITDHAIVRYLERVEKADIQELKLRVAAHRNAVMDGNVIVTVNEDNFYEDDEATT